MNNKNANHVVIECRDVYKSFSDGTRELRILRGVNMVVREAEYLAIIGASGAGKTTLLHLVGTLDRPSKGEILFRDKAVNKMSRHYVNRIRNEEIGFVFQFYHLLPEFTAFENVMMPALSRGKRPSACKKRAEELLEKVGLSDRMTHKPGQLSGGEQQRVAIARALFNNPSVILADEPTGNLDEQTGGGITDLLVELNRSENVTLVLVTHDDQVAGRADRIVRLHDGIAEEVDLASEL